MNEAIGKIYKVDDAVQVTDKLRKVLIVLEIGTSYPQYVQFEATNTKIEQLASFFEGDQVKVTFFLNGRRWTDTFGIEKYFNTLSLNTITKC